MVGVAPRRADDMLEQVGLGSVSGRRVRAYSLGMRQRLGIGQALLGDPEVLVLDEPANGLDPEGIRWMRDLLHGQAARGGTVLISSHLLLEIEATADRVVLLQTGRVITQGSLTQLLGRREDAVVVHALDQDQVARTLTAAGLVTGPGADGGLLVHRGPSHPDADVDLAELVARTAARSGHVVTGLQRPEPARLEELFMSFTQEAGQNPGSARTSTAMNTPANGVPA